MDIEEIREGVWQILHSHEKYGEWSIVVSDIFSYLAEKEACFPVEGELPRNLFGGNGEAGIAAHIAYESAQQDYASYKKVTTLKEMLDAD